MKKLFLKIVSHKNNDKFGMYVLSIGDCQGKSIRGENLLKEKNKKMNVKLI